MKIFLSYASEQRELADAVQLGLRGLGHEVFFDRDALGVAGNYLARITDEIQRADLLVFLVSPESVAHGRYTLSELDVARRRWPHPQGRVMPVMSAPTPFSAIPQYLKAVTVLEPKGNLVADVVHAVQFDISRPQSDRSGEDRPASGSPMRSRAMWVRSMVVGIALPIVVFNVGLLLVRLDVMIAESLNYLPPFALATGVLGVLWVLGRRG